MRDLVVVFLLAAHLLAMNVASAGPLVGAWLAWRGSDGRGSRQVFTLALAALAIGSLLGGALLARPTEAMLAALRRFPADAYWYGGAELLFSAACMATLIIGGQRLSGRRWLILAIALASAANLLYHFPPLMAVIGELAADPQWAAAERIDRATLLRLWTRREILALWAHFVLASLAVSPIAAAWLLRGRNAQAELHGPAVQRRLGAWSLAATVLQVPVGLWLLSTTSHPQRQSMLGSELVVSVCFAGGLMAAIWLLQTLMAIALGENHRTVGRAGWLLILVTLLMTATLHLSRKAVASQLAEGAQHASTAAAIADR